MSILTDLRRAFSPFPQSDHSRVRTVMQERSILFEADAFPVSDQIVAMRNRRLGGNRAYRLPSTREALGVPSIQGAVTLIANTVGSLTMRALRNEVELPPRDRPQIIVRPNPLSTPRDFFAETAWNIAVHGEAWWWIAKRDSDGNATALINVHPAEITVDVNQRNRLRPIISWNTAEGSKEIPNEDIRQMVYNVRDPETLRGIGPLQRCGAAISVTVESQAWAANFYADGSFAPLIIKSAVELGEDPDDPDSLTEAERLAEDWNSKGNNRPRVIDPRIEDVSQLNVQEGGAQMLDGRMYQNGETARMYNMPGSLLEYAMSGSSLTYQNLSTIYDDFLRRCLRPNYLKSIEQTMSDLLTRSTVAKFDTDVLTLADAKTRYETYGIGIDKGILTPEQAQSFEGLQPGDTDNAPVPFSPPQSIPTILPIQQRSELQEVRCSCGRLAGRFSGPFETRCSKCGQLVTAA